MFALAALFALAGGRSDAATRTWTGLSTESNLWSDHDNWDGATPIANDDLVFPAGAGNLTNVNDLPSSMRLFTSITVNGDYDLSGEAITISLGGMNVGGGANPTFTMQVWTTNSQTWTIGNGASLRMEHLIPNEVTLAGPGQSHLSVSGSGLLVLSEGLAQIDFLPPFNGTLRVTGGRMEVSGPSGTSAKVEVQGVSCTTSACPAGVALSNTVVRSMNVTAGYLEVTAARTLEAASGIGSLVFGTDSLYRVIAPPASMWALRQVSGLTSPESKTLDGATVVIVHSEPFIGCSTLRLVDFAGMSLNLGSSGASTEFKDLPDESTFTTASGQQFRITYGRFDFNDVMLTAVDADLPFCQGVHSDVDGTRHSDILWRHSSGVIYQWTMRGFTIVSEKPLRAIEDEWKAVGLADFSGEGWADVFWRHDFSGQNALWLHAVHSTVYHVNYASDTNWKIVATGDYDGDGKGDVFWRHALSGDNYVYFMDGPVIRAAYFAPAVPDTNWSIVGSGDLNRDFRSDLVWRNSATGETYAWLMSGNSVIGTGMIAVIPDPNWRVAAVSDFDGDRQADVFWRNDATGENYLYRMSGPNVIAQGYINIVADLDWKVAAVADYNGDRKSDILWRHAVTGDNYVYMMDGFMIETPGYLPQVPDLDWVVIP
jgi:hypothetical protein